MLAGVRGVRGRLVCRGYLPELFEGYGDFDAIGRLGGVEGDGGLVRGRHCKDFR